MGKKEKNRVSKKYIKACRKNQERKHDVFLKTLSSRKKKGKTWGKPGQGHGELHMLTKDMILEGRTPSLGLLC